MTVSSWNELAGGWARWRTHLDTAYRPVRDWLLAELALRPGETLLELAAGTGSAGFDALRAVSGEARLISTDLAPEMVRAAQQHGTALGLSTVEYKVLDAQRLDLAADSVDRVLCESGFMLTPDPALALAETRRVLRGGGRLAFSVWGPPEDNPWDTLAEELLAELGWLPPHERGDGQLSDVDELDALVRRCGFDSVHVAEIPVCFEFADLAEWERWSVDTNTTGALIGSMAAGGRAEFLARVAAAFAPYRSAQGFALPGLALCVRAA